MQHTKQLWIFALLTTAAAARAQGVQNIDVSFMLGAIHTNGGVVDVIAPGTTVTNVNTPAPTVAGTTGLLTEVGFGYQVHTFSAGSLYFEVPLLWSWRGSGSVNSSGLPQGTVVGLTRNNWYVTPGLRWKIPTGTRLSFNLAAGGGVAILHAQQTSIDPASVSIVSQTDVNPTFDFGGGIDFRVNRWLSLRVDIRDYIHSPGFGGTGLNHWEGVGGVAFHF
jgi:hypothetical protein